MTLTVAQIVRLTLELRGTRGKDNISAYLLNMGVRLKHLKRVLKPTGSVYLHCDPTASHYLKMLMDAVFGHHNFQNEFIWHYGGGGASRKRWAKKHDVILFYSRGTRWAFNADAVRTPHKWTDGQKRADGSERNEQGKLGEDVWSHHSLMPWSSERLGYPTQKPLVLLERIISASTNRGDLVLDPFCGCGTTLHAAEKLGRRWIGIDISRYAASLVKNRLLGNFDKLNDFSVSVFGLPTTVDEARGLAAKSLDGRFEFESKRDQKHRQQPCLDA